MRELKNNNNNNELPRPLPESDLRDVLGWLFTTQKTDIAHHNLRCSDAYCTYCYSNYILLLFSVRSFYAFNGRADLWQMQKCKIWFTGSKMLEFLPALKIQINGWTHFIAGITILPEPVLEILTFHRCGSGEMRKYRNLRNELMEVRLHRNVGVHCTNSIKWFCIKKKSKSIPFGAPEVCVWSGHNGTNHWHFFFLNPSFRII